MDNNDLEISDTKRKIYTRDELKSYQNSDLSKQWPKSLDQTCTNSYGQWDPVKSFDSSLRVAEVTKRNSFYENRNYKNNDFIPDKTKDDISLRPERRRWNDGCQVTNKRNDDGNHTTGYKKSYQQNIIPNCGGGDYDRSRYQRNRKIRDDTSTGKFIANNKSERISRNNSNLDDRRDDYVKINGNNHQRAYNNTNRNRNAEPAWMLDGPDNCNETIELHGITQEDTNMLNFKMNPTDGYDIKPVETIKESKLEQNNQMTEAEENKALSVDLHKILNIEDKTAIKSPNTAQTKREGSRFQDIFQKEAKTSVTNESREVESFLKAVLSDKVGHLDADKLNNISKPLPNGVLTLEEIEQDINSKLKNEQDKEGVNEFKQQSQSEIVNLAFGGNSQLSLLANNLSSPSADTSKVVNWLSNLNTSTKENVDQTSQSSIQPPISSSTHHHQSGLSHSYHDGNIQHIHQQPQLPPQQQPQQSRSTQMQMIPQQQQQQPYLPNQNLSFNNGSTINNNTGTNPSYNKYLSSPPGLSMNSDIEQPQQIKQFMHQLQMQQQQQQQSNAHKWQLMQQNNGSTMNPNQLQQRNAAILPFMMRQQHSVNDLDIMNKLNTKEANAEILSNAIIKKPGVLQSQYPNANSNIHQSSILDQQRMVQMQQQHQNSINGPLPINNIPPPGLDCYKMPIPQQQQQIMGQSTPSSLPLYQGMPSSQSHLPVNSLARPIVKTSSYANTSHGTSHLNAHQLSILDQQQHQNAISAYFNNIKANNTFNNQRHNTLTPLNNHMSMPNFDEFPNNKTSNRNTVGSSGPVNHSRFVNQLNSWLPGNPIQSPFVSGNGSGNTGGHTHPQQNPHYFQQYPSTQMPQQSHSNSNPENLIANLLKSGSTGLPPVPQQAKYADQLETENF